MDWADTPGGTAGNSAFGNLFDDYSVSSSSNQRLSARDYGRNSSQRQGIDLFQMPMITGLFDLRLLGAAMLSLFMRATPD